MNTRNYFSQTKQRNWSLTFFALFCTLWLQAQCVLVPWAAPAVPISAGCVAAPTPSLFLENLATNCVSPTTNFNLKIYATDNVTVIYNGDNVGLNGAFPPINIAALNLNGMARKFRIERNPAGLFVEGNVKFYTVITCTDKTVEANDNLVIPANAALMPNNASGCVNGLQNICYVDGTQAAGDCAAPSIYTSLLRIIKFDPATPSACSHTIFVKKGDINNVTAPANYVNTTKACTAVLADRHQDITGYPQLNGNPLKGNTSNIEVTFADVLQNTCNGTIYYRRTYTLRDACTNATRTFTQEIRFNDTQAPVIQPIANITIGTDVNSCVATNKTIPTAIFTENCSPVLSAALITNASTSIFTTNGAIIASLATGVYNIRYTAADACGNLATPVDVQMRVIDNIAPVITCSAKMISLNNLGTARVNGTNFLDNVTDNCGVSLLSTEIKRMNEPNTAYKAYIDATCADINVPFMVILKLTDLNGNVNFCMTTASTQDKLAPSFSNLNDVTVNCVVDTSSLAAFGDPIVTDLCGVTFTRKITNWTIENCQTGTFNIEYTATDNSGNKGTASKKVTVVNPTPFNPATITKPKDLIIKNFNGNIALLEPAKLDTGSFAPAIPKWTYTGCDLIATSKTDEVFSISGSPCCFKIVRHWKVANCCMKDAVTGLPKIVWTHTQVIKIEDTLPPEIKGMVGDITVGTQNCVANFTLPKPTFINDCAGILPLSSLIVQTTMATKDANDPFKFTNVAKGIYDVTYRATDACGNVGTYAYKVTVKDTTRPTAIARHGIAANLGADGTLMLSPKYFNQDSKDNCTPTNKLRYAFSPNPADTMLSFDCSSFLPDCDNPKKVIAVKLYVFDEVGNFDFVNTYVEIQKLNTPCSCFKNIAGAIKTEKGTNVEDVLVTIKSLNGASFTKPFTTGSGGVFKFPNIVTGDYTVAPKKINEPANGVSTSDVLVITKHILGQQLFTSPYQWLAADINNSKTITTSDVVELRKLILGINKDFVKNYSWRFLDKSYVFTNAANPLQEQFAETKTVLTGAENTDFIAIKIGDLNNSAKANGNVTGDATGRADKSIVFMTDDVKIKAGETMTIPFKVKDLKNVAGYQFTINFDQTMLDFVNISHKDNGSDADFGLNNLSKGVITTSWMNPLDLPLPAMETVFNVTFKAKSTDFLSKLVKFTSDFTSAEAYSHSGELMDVQLDFMPMTTTTNELENTHFEVFQNQPNPFKGTTLIGFQLPAASNATLSIYDQTGRLIKRIDDSFNKGFNEIRVADLNVSGMLMYRLETLTHSATRRMLVLE